MKKILVDPDPRLRKICADITNIDGYVRSLAKELSKVIAHSSYKIEDYVMSPIGMAAPQLGELVRLFVIETPGFSVVMINPQLTKTSGSHRLYESCMSIPGRTFVVERPKVVKLKGLDLEGNERSIKVHDTLAQAVMHETEHLHGIMVDNVAVAEVVGEANSS
jgi:peptide deformylase